MNSWSDCSQFIALLTWDRGQQMLTMFKWGYENEYNQEFLKI